MQVVREADARAPVVGVILQLPAAAVLERLQIALVVLRLRGKRLPDRIAVLVEIETFPEVVTQAGVDGEIPVHRDVILRIVVVLLDRRLVAEETAEDGDIGDRRSLAVGRERVLTGCADREIAAKDWLIDVVRADFEVVAH